MNREAARGGTLLAGGRRFGASPGLLSRLFAGGGHKLLDRVDAGLARGSILATLPDGTTRLLGGRAEGFVAEVELRDWRALLRVATGGSCGWYQAWVMCWRNGQRSPIHDHKGSSCAVRVLRGTLTETLFAFAPNGRR